MQNLFDNFLFLADMCEHCYEKSGLETFSKPGTES
jgi:hypothetical protein